VSSALVSVVQEVNMSSDPPPPYPGGPSAPLIEEKNGQPVVSGNWVLLPQSKMNVDDLYCNKASMLLWY